ncbi:MAG: hypothetical protein KatS3mg102_1021 [Planctomycetota bacterium]|nr:MAG: hypothetical protein KatS3mg102_1021 [Planctomycetota bacterium]
MAAVSAVVGAAFLGGCATLFAPGPDVVPVDSTPRGATVKLNGQVVGSTPMAVTLHRDREALLAFEYPGYRPHLVSVERQLNPVTLLNILFFPAFVVDGVAHNVQRYPELPVHAVLQPAEPGAPPTTGWSGAASPPARPPAPLDVQPEVGPLPEVRIAPPAEPGAPLAAPAPAPEPPAAAREPTTGGSRGAAPPPPPAAARPRPARTAGSSSPPATRSAPAAASRPATEPRPRCSPPRERQRARRAARTALARAPCGRCLAPPRRRPRGDIEHMANTVSGAGVVSFARRRALEGARCWRGCRRPH